MTEILDTLKSARDYLDSKDDWVNDQLTDHITMLEKLEKLGDLTAVKATYEVARVGIDYFLTEFDDLPAAGKEFFKAFYDAAREGTEPRAFKVGDLVRITGPLKTANGSDLYLFESGEIAKVTNPIDSEGDVLIEPLNGEDDNYIDAKSLTLVTPRKWDSLADVPTDVQVTDSFESLVRFDEREWVYDCDLGCCKGYSYYTEFPPFTEVIK
ncbi:hypothetical protein ACFXG4_23490 [Nocardia sp. NPDC059246]|uniref:hypothetical protein n=1 Tax=unclassified Nocardia TaxID=2637762 RepID=UPI0036B02D99